MLNAPGAARVNRSGLVGRRLMLHPFARVTGFFDTPMDGHRGIAVGSLVSHHFYETDTARGFRRGVKLQALGTHGPALTALGSLGRRAPWGRTHHRAFSQMFGHAYSLSVCAEDAPDPENRITLSDRLTGSDGLPAAWMIYKIPAEAKLALDCGRDRAREILALAGAQSLSRWKPSPRRGFT